MERSQVLNDPEQALRIALDGQQGALWTAIPGIVESVNLATLTCEVQPAIQGVVTDENGVKTYVNLPLLIHVPIMFPACGGFIMSMPLAKGDEVLVVFASRCIDSWWQNGGFENIPMEDRKHDLSDGFAFPAQMSQPKVEAAYDGGLSSANARLSKADGSCYLEITPSGAVNIVAPGGVNVTGNLVVSGSINAASVTASGEVTGNAIPLSTHKHTGVTPGGGETGGPTA